MDLDGPFAKLDRAMEHLKALDLACQGFLNTEPFYVAAELESDIGCHVVRLHIRKGVPLPFSVVLGDLIHNLRSGLDHAAWLIACRSNSVEHLWKPEIAREVYFPITDSPAEFEGHSLMPFIAEDAKAILEPLQPYHGEDGPQAHPLTRLNRFWNIDKHRVVHAGFARLDMSTVSFVPMGILVEDGMGEFDVEWCLERGEPVEDGTKVALIRFAQGPETTKVEMKGQPTAEVLFGARGTGLGLSLFDFAVIQGHVAKALADIRELPDTPT